jgi:Do/DeqQ family serine protease
MRVLRPIGHSHPRTRKQGNLPVFLAFLAVLFLAVGAFAFWRLMRPTVVQTAYPLPSQGGVPAPKARVPLESDRSLETIDREFTDLVEHVIPSVVSITTTTAPDRDALIRQLFGLGGGNLSQGSKMGTGMIVSPEGYIVTNCHVVNGASQVTVTLNDGRKLSAVIAGTDQRSDIAVLKVESGGLTPIDFGDSELVRVGQMVFAVGNPFGLQETVTQGIISAKGRRTASEADHEFFQTSTTINPGNSGGPLIDIHGKVIGINNFILSRSGGSEGIGFAIPSNVARRVYEQIIHQGRVLHPWMGIVLSPLTPALARQLGLPDTTGALVAATLAGSPAEKSGITPGDVITALNGHPVSDWRDLRNRIAEVPVGSTATFALLRGGKSLQIDTVLEEEPGQSN